MYFLDYINRKERQKQRAERSRCCSTYPAFRSSWETELKTTLVVLRQSQAEDSLTTGNLFFSSFAFFCCFVVVFLLTVIPERPRRARLGGADAAEGEARFSGLFSRDLPTKAEPAVPELGGTQPGGLCLSFLLSFHVFLSSYPLTALTFFLFFFLVFSNVTCAFCFLQQKKRTQKLKKKS